MQFAQNLQYLLNQYFLGIFTRNQLNHLSKGKNRKKALGAQADQLGNDEKQ